MSASDASSLSAALVASAALTEGLAQISNYVQTWNGFSLDEAGAYPLSVEALSPKSREAVQSGVVDPASIPMLAVSSYVRTAQGYERALLKSVGLETPAVDSLLRRESELKDHFVAGTFPWQQDNLSGLLLSQIEGLHNVMGKAFDAVMDRRGIVSRFRDAKDLSIAQTYGPVLAPLQALLIRRIRQANKVAADYDLRTEAALDVFFRRRRDARRSGPILIEEGADALFDSTPPPPLAG